MPLSAISVGAATGSRDWGAATRACIKTVSRPIGGRARRPYGGPLRWQRRRLVVDRRNSAGLPPWCGEHAELAGLAIHSLLLVEHPSCRAERQRHQHGAAPHRHACRMRPDARLCSGLGTCGPHHGGAFAQLHLACSGSHRLVQIGDKPVLGEFGFEYAQGKRGGSRARVQRRIDPPRSPRQGFLPQQSTASRSSTGRFDSRRELQGVEHGTQRRAVPRFRSAGRQSRRRTGRQHATQALRRCRRDGGRLAGDAEPGHRRERMQVGPGATQRGRQMSTQSGPDGPAPASAGWSEPRIACRTAPKSSSSGRSSGSSRILAGVTSPCRWPASCKVSSAASSAWGSPRSEASLGGLCMLRRTAIRFWPA